MASYADQLRARLYQIGENTEAATTWEQLKQARSRQQRAAQQAMQVLNGQTSAYHQQLANLQNMGAGMRYVPPKPLTTKPATTKKATKQKKPSSLGSSFGSGVSGIVGGIFG